MAGSIYSAEADLNLDPDRLVELTDTSLAPGVKNQAAMDATSLEAQDIIDDALLGLYVVPFDNITRPVPPAVRRMHAKLWRYLLFDRRDALSIPPSVLADSKQVYDDLKDYATADGGKILYGAQQVSGAGPNPQSGSFAADPDNTNPPARIFGRYRDTLG